MGLIVATLLMSTAVGATVKKNIEVIYNSVNLVVNGKKVNADNIIYNGTTYVPLRAIGEMLGKEIGWDQTTYTASIDDKISEKPVVNDSNPNSFTYKDENGNALYSIEIKGIKVMSERNQYSDKNPAEVYLIDYKYTNINNPEELFIGDSSYKVIDSQGKVGYTYPNSKTNYPQGIPKGVSCDAQMVFGVDNVSSEISLLFYDNMFRESDKAFKLEIR